MLPPFIFSSYCLASYYHIPMPIRAPVKPPAAEPTPHLRVQPQADPPQGKAQYQGSPMSQFPQPTQSSTDDNAAAGSGCRPFGRSGVLQVGEMPGSRLVAQQNRNIIA
jgi:hypothetical protein